LNLNAINVVIDRYVLTTRSTAAVAGHVSCCQSLVRRVNSFYYTRKDY